MMDTEADLIKKENGDCDHVDATAVRDKDFKRKRTKKGLIRLTFDSLASLFLGMQVSQKGPSFLDLQLISGTDVKGASSYFTGNSFGYMVGALTAGVIYDRIGNKMILICIPLTLASFVIGLTPWCASYITMLLVHFASATQCAVAETTITADQFTLWPGKNDAVFQVLSFSYSLGGVLGPLYTKPFLAPKGNNSDNNAAHSQAQERNPKTGNFSRLIYNSQNHSVPFISIGESSSKVDFEGNLSNSLLNFEDPPESQLYYAYMITGLFGILFAIPFYIYCCKNCSTPSNKDIKNKEPVEVPQKRLTLTPYIVLTIISSSLMFFYTMTEDSFNMFLSMFVVSHLSWTKENGALVSSLYWGISTISKLISVPLVRRFDLGIILLISCVGMVISLLGFLFSSIYRIDVLIWITSSLFSMSQSAIFGGCFSWADTHILKLDGKATSVTMVAAASGAMIGPLILGITMDNISLMVFPYIELINSMIATCIFILMFYFLEPYVTRKYGPVRPNPKDIICTVDSETVVEEEKIMMTDNDERKCDNFEVRESNGVVST